MTTYLVPHDFGYAEFTEKRSRFIGRVWRTDTEEEALSRIREMRDTHSDATHNVYAYIIRDNNITRYSDDGEPGGTAGMPTLNVFSCENIQNVCCVVTRYFGGTLLGAGGLVRAYSKAAKLALEAAGIAQMAQWTEFEITVDYGFYQRARPIFDELQAQLTDTDFGALVKINALVRADRAEAFEARLVDASGGKAQICTGNSVFQAIKIK